MIPIFILAGSIVLTATLDDTAVAHSFAALLPLEVSLSDYHGIEKVADLPRRLKTGSAPDSYAASRGDITLYAPWGNLAIFYRDFPSAPGLIRLGALDAPTDVRLEALMGRVRFERTL
ncbi:hypothetical protein KM176_00475 [Pseudooceanicola sp. CBS1P-1]|uniref:Cyclophilin-like domain-containing protein n=1 Tax=Pseudooceanicola albus TaxID=2692189 RepID=A0A6L7G2R0_9RHOB|nr:MULTISPECIES: cyclophilin-like fold protein [Pseudooceanicola]MBT9382321.1 hypothetical protein [Pseudooceanicola endophyticus]MXN16863.1 hypothetical protein [Pseudooceanicola albus]